MLGGVLLPLGIALLSNSGNHSLKASIVLLPLGVTLLSNDRPQLSHRRGVLLPLGITLLSNAPFAKIDTTLGFTTSWDYTTLKRWLQMPDTSISFTTTWDYTTLKLRASGRGELRCFAST